MSQASHSLPGGGLDPVAQRRALDRAAATYDEAAVLAHEVADRLLERFSVMQVRPERLLVADARSGADARALKGPLPKTRKTLVDPSPAMLRQARRRRGWRSRQAFCAARTPALPFPAGTFGMAWSNLGLPWVDDLDAALAELHRVVEPGGLLLFSSLGPDTLAELRTALGEVFGEAAPELPLFLDMHDVGDALTRAGFEGVVMENETLTLTYPDLEALLREARATASGALLRQRRRGLLTPRQWRALEAALPREAGRLPARFEVVYAHAWRGERPGTPADAGGTARISPDQIGRAGSSGGL
jgi:malonyl-CoA O-methyltransferase